MKGLHTCNKYGLNLYENRLGYKIWFKENGNIYFMKQKYPNNKLFYKKFGIVFSQITIDLFKELFKLNSSLGGFI